MRAGEEIRAGVRVRRHRADPRFAPKLRRAQELAFRLRLPGNGALRTVYDGPLAPGMLRDAAHEPADVIGATAFPLLHMQFAVAAARARRDAVRPARRAASRRSLGIRSRADPPRDRASPMRTWPTPTSSATTSSAWASPPSAST